jgi:hypothetical protein
MNEARVGRENIRLDETMSKQLKAGLKSDILTEQLLRESKIYDRLEPREINLKKWKDTPYEQADVTLRNMDRNSKLGGSGAMLSRAIAEKGLDIAYMEGKITREAYNSAKASEDFDIISLERNIPQEKVFTFNKYETPHSLRTKGQIAGSKQIETAFNKPVAEGYTKKIGEYISPELKLKMSMKNKEILNEAKRFQKLSKRELLKQREQMDIEGGSKVRFFGNADSILNSMTEYLNNARRKGIYNERYIEELKKDAESNYLRNTGKKREIKLKDKDIEIDNSNTRDFDPEKNYIKNKDEIMNKYIKERGGLDKLTEEDFSKMHKEMLRKDGILKKIYERAMPRRLNIAYPKIELIGGKKAGNIYDPYNILKEKGMNIEQETVMKAAEGKGLKTTGSISKAVKIDLLHKARAISTNMYNKVMDKINIKDKDIDFESLEILRNKDYKGYSEKIERTLNEINNKYTRIERKMTPSGKGYYEVEGQPLGAKRDIFTGKAMEKGRITKLESKYFDTGKETIRTFRADKNAPHFKVTRILEKDTGKVIADISKDMGIISKARKLARINGNIKILDKDGKIIQTHSSFIDDYLNNFNRAIGTTDKWMSGADKVILDMKLKLLDTNRVMLNKMKRKDVLATQTALDIGRITGDKMRMVPEGARRVLYDDTKKGMR